MNYLNKFFFKTKKVLKNFEKHKREHLKELYQIKTDKATYIAYNTQTIKNDWVNIEIEENRNGKTKIILQNEIFDDSWGTMGGDSFLSLVIDSRNHLLNYIKNKQENILSRIEPGLP